MLCNIVVLFWGAAALLIYISELFVQTKQQGPILLLSTRRVRGPVASERCGKSLEREQISIRKWGPSYCGVPRYAARVARVLEAARAVRLLPEAVAVIEA